MSDTSSASQSNVDINNIVTDLNGKADVDGTNATFPHVVSRVWHTANKGIVEIWSDGYCVQWGYAKSGTTITFAQPYKGTNYNITLGVCSASGDNQATEPKISIKSTTQLKWNQAYGGSTTYNAASYEWRTEGYIK